MSAPARVTVAAEPAAGGPDRRRRLPLWPVLTVCAAFRLWYLTTRQGQIDGDEATTGLMVQRILHGHLYAFLAGQHYNGAFEQYLQAPVWTVLPRTPFTLRLPEVGLAVLACWLVYRVARELLDPTGADPARAWLAAALFALGPFFNVWKGVRSHGPYPAGQVLGLLGLWLALRLAAGPTRPRRLAALFGVIAGAAAWLTWSTAYLLIPAAAWLLPTLRRRPGLLAPAAAGGLLGYAPAIAWAVANGQIPGLGGPQPERTPYERLRLLSGPVLREFLGVGYLNGVPGWPRVAQTLTVAGAMGAYAVACWRRRHGLADLVLLRDRHRAPTDVLLLVPPVVAVLYALSKYTWWAGEPRYLFTAYPALALGLAAAVPRRPARLALPVAAAMVVAVGGTSVVTAVRHAGDGDRGRAACFSAGIDWLTLHGITAAYSDYWTGMPLQLAAGDRVSIGPMNAGRAKFPELRSAADARPPVYVLGHLADPMNQQEDRVAAMDRALRAHGVIATRTAVGCLVVYTDLRPALRPWDLGLGLRMPLG